MTGTGAATTALTQLLTRPPAADLAARVAWVQALAVAIDDADLGPAGTAAAQDVRAALGAIVAWGRGPRTPDSVVELNGLMAALLRRASSTLYRALSETWRALAAADAGAVGVADAFAAAAAAIDAGDDVPADVVAVLRR